MNTFSLILKYKNSFKMKKKKKNGRNILPEKAKNGGYIANFDEYLETGTRPIVFYKHGNKV